MSEIILVRIEDLPKTPKAFQQYVHDWFAPKNVLGVDCMVATGLCVGFDHTHWARKGRKPGVAPSHSVELSSYKEGLKPNQGLNDWMRKNDKKLVWLLYAAEERDSGSFYDDD